MSFLRKMFGGGKDEAAKPDASAPEQRAREPFAEVPQPFRKAFTDAFASLNRAVLVESHATYPTHRLYFHAFELDDAGLKRFFAEPAVRKVLADNGVDYKTHGGHKIYLSALEDADPKTVGGKIRRDARDFAAKLRHDWIVKGMVKFLPLYETVAQAVRETGNARVNLDWQIAESLVKADKYGANADGALSFADKVEDQHLVVVHFLDMLREDLGVRDVRLERGEHATYALVVQGPELVLTADKGGPSGPA